MITEARKIIPGSRMEIVKGTAHSAHYEKADEFNAHLAPFFAGILAEQTAGAPAD